MSICSEGNTQAQKSEAKINLYPTLGFNNFSNNLGKHWRDGSSFHRDNVVATI